MHEILYMYYVDCLSNLVNQRKYNNTWFLKFSKLFFTKNMLTNTSVMFYKFNLLFAEVARKSLPATSRELIGFAISGNS